MGGICKSKIHSNKKGSIEKNAANKSDKNSQAKNSRDMSGYSLPENSNDIEPKPSGEIFEYTKLIDRNTDFKAIAQNIEEFLNSREFPNEKLRVALKILRDLTEEEEEVPKNSKISVGKFYSLVERHYRKLYDEFEIIKQTWKPLIKLLEIFDLFLENFDDNNLRKEIVDRIYKLLNEKKMIIEDWRFLRKLCEQRAKEDLTILSSWRGDLVQGFYRRVKFTQKALLWKDETEGPKYAREALDFILTLKEEILFEFLLMGRFDKKKANVNQSFTMIVGDDGGVFLLINKVPPGSRQEKLVLDSGVSKNFLEEKREKETNKVILGKGSFGKVRLALSIIGSKKVDIGQLVCVKKSLPIVPIGEKKSRQTNFLINITDSTLEDFFASKLNESIHTPIPLDMAILNSNLNENQHRKGYLFMELVPENTADKIFGEKNYQKWEYQKPYILAVLKTTYDMLIKDRVFNSDLKPPNTLFDPLSRKMAIIDLGSSLLIKKDQYLKNFDASVGGFGVSKPYCPPEIDDPNQLTKLDLKKAVSYLCGVTIAEVTCSAPAERKTKLNFEAWELSAENTNLDKQSKNSLIVTIRGLTEKNPLKRMDISDAINNIEKIGSDVDEIMKKATSEQYIEKLRRLIKENPSLLSLNEDINETRQKGIIKQMAVENNPKRYKNQKTQEVHKELDDILKNEKEEAEKLLVLLGEAGSGKSLALQLRFVQEVEEWQYGKHALPLFFNMADEVNLEKVFNRLNTMLGCNIKLEDPNSDEIHLFVDSYDEGKIGIIDNNKQSAKDTRMIEQYFENLRKWKKSKIVISCRTDFVQREGEDNLSEFQVRSLRSTMYVRYIAPVDYKTANLNSNGNQDSKNKNVLNKGEDDFFGQVRDWLNRENRKEKPEEIIRILKTLALEEQMRTGLMFNMIMQMTLKMQGENLNELRLKGFEIYRRTIGEEFRLNWEKIVSAKGSGDKNSWNTKKEKFKEIKEVIQQKLGLENYDIDDNNSIAKDGFEVIWEGMERIGELIAAEMSLNNSNRVKYSEFERLLLEQTGNKDNDSESDVRTEWKALYQILRIMGLKLEKRNTFVAKQNKEKSHLNNLEDESIIEIGFRHETYKNYYLLRGLKRLLPVFLRDMSSQTSEVNKNASDDLEKIQTKKIVAATLKVDGLNSNYELLRFCGEEVKNYKDSSLREGLLRILSLEQKKCREGKINENQKAPPTSSVHGFEDKLERFSKISPSAGAMSLLVAGSYQFWEEDLGDLDLAGAYMRGGTFCMSKFEKTNLRNANLRHANVSQASFVNSDLRGLQLGVWPDLIGHTLRVTSVSFSPEGKKIASGGNDNTVKIWNSGTGECLKTLEGHSGEVNSVNFSPDWKKVASGSHDKTVKIWDSGSGECLQTLAGHSGKVYSVNFSFDGRKVASGGDDKKVNIWDIGSGKCVQTLVGHSDRVSSVSFSPEENKVVSGSYDRSVKIWDSGSGKCLQTLAGISWIVFSVIFSPDGKKIASGDDGGRVKIWDSRSGECVQTLRINDTGQVYSVSFSHDGKKVASGCGDNTVKIWDSISGECIQILSGHSQKVLSVSFSPDGNRVTSGSDDSTVKIWDTGRGESVQTLAAHSKRVFSVSFSPDRKKLASGSCDDTIKIWDSGTGECLKTLVGHSGEVNSVSFSPDGKKIASGSSDETVKIWDSGNGECAHTLAGHPGPVHSVSFSPDGKKIASGTAGPYANPVKIWDSESGECLQTLEGNSGRVYSVNFSPDGRKVVSSDDEKNLVKVWDVGSGKCVQNLAGHSDWVNSVSFSPDGVNVASGSRDNTIKIWDIGSGKCVQTLAGHSWWVSSVSFSPDGKKVASGSFDDTVKIWDSRSGECVQTLVGHSKGVYSVSFSSDGKKVACGSSDNTVKIWDSSRSAECVQTLAGVSVSFSPDKKKVACGVWDNKIKIWDSGSGKCVQTLAGHSREVFSVSFSSDGKRLVSRSWDNTVKHWDSETGALLQTTEAVDEANNLLFTQNPLRMKYFLKWSSNESLIEDDFKCDSTIILSCLFDKDKELDKGNEISFKQRSGQVYT